MMHVVGQILAMAQHLPLHLVGTITGHSISWRPSDNTTARGPRPGRGLVAVVAAVHHRRHRRSLLESDARGNDFRTPNSGDPNTWFCDTRDTRAAMVAVSIGWKTTTKQYGNLDTDNRRTAYWSTDWDNTRPCIGWWWWCSSCSCGGLVVVVAVVLVLHSP